MPLITRAEYLEIDGIPLATPAWEITDLSPLWDAANQRGSDRLIPGADGVLPQPRRKTITVKSLPMIIMGDRDQEGDYAGEFARAQLRENVDYLIANVVDPPETSDGLRFAILHLPDGDEVSGHVHVSGLQLGMLGPIGLRAILTVSMPDGRLVLNGS